MTSISKPIPLVEPNLGGNAQRYLNECIETNFVSSIGPFVERFEREFAEFVGVKHAVACSSGTAAIHVAMRLLGVERGDLVAVSDFTFVASVNPIAYEGATPLLIDSEEQSWNMDPGLLADELRSRARRGLPLPTVVEVVHILGQPAQIEAIVEICDEYGIPIIEDASEALGATYTEGRYAGRQVGSIGQVGCFSFNGNKIITTGGGGMITTNDPALAARAKHLTTHARLPGIAYAHDEIGYNYRLTNIAAALGVAQLELLSGFLEAKRRLARSYDAALFGLGGLTLPPRPSWSDPSFWLYTVRLPAALDPRELAVALREAGIDARPVWPPIHTLPMFDTAPRRRGAIADDLFRTGLSLPSSTSLAEDEQRVVIDELRSRVADRVPRRAGP